MEKLLVICGPTASGKSALALALAQEFNGEIISADSMQIYREMQIGTAKPNDADRLLVPHHMLDVVSVTEEYNVARYCEDAARCIDKVIAKGKLPILAGGTGLYIDSVVNNVNFFTIENDPAFRRQLKAYAQENGVQALHERLNSVDPTAAKRLHPNDVKRVVRALEVYHVTGKTITETQEESKRAPRYDVLQIGLDFIIRDHLYERIDLRVTQMIADGWVEEAQALSALSLSNTALSAIGYRELFAFLAGRCTLNEAVATIQQNTRRYAKRQLTWFRKNKETRWIFPDDPSETPLQRAEEILTKEDWL